MKQQNCLQRTGVTYPIFKQYTDFHSVFHGAWFEPQSCPYKWSNKSWDCLALELISPGHFLQQEWNLILISGNGSCSYFVAALGLLAFYWLQFSCYKLLIFKFFFKPICIFFLVVCSLRALKIGEKIGSSHFSLIGIALPFGKKVALYSLGVKEDGNIKEWIGWKTERAFNLVLSPELV